MEWRLVALGMALALGMAGCDSDDGGGGGGGGSPATGGGGLSGKDLHFANVMAHPRSQPGAMQIHATVRYRDSAGSTATGIAWQIRRETGAVLASGTITQIEPGESRQLMADVVGIADRERLVVAVDTAAVVDEVYEQNNTVTVTAIFGEQPTPTADIDLLFSDSHYHGTYYSRDPRFHFFVRNPNTRGEDVANVRVVILIDGIQRWSRVFDRVRAPTPEQLAGEEYPGREVTTTTSEVFGASSVPPGRYVATIIIDPDNEIAETDESNNYRRLIIEVDAGQQVSFEPTAIPDIQLEDPHFHQFARFALWHFWISNVYAGPDARAVSWRLVREDGVVVRSGVEVVGPQELKEVVFGVPKDGDAEIRYRLDFDYDNTVPERDESNNSVGFIVDWTPESSG